MLMNIPPALVNHARTVQTAEGEIFCYELGSEGEPLILIHGLGDEADTWQAVLPLLGKRRVVALDLPGFGRSPSPKRGPTLTTYARSVLALMDELGILRATLVGSSLGAAIAQRVALARPPRVRRLVLIDGSLPLEASAPNRTLLLFMLPIIGPSIYRSLRHDNDKAYATLRPYYHALDELPEWQRQFLYQRVAERVASERQMNAYIGTLRWLTIDSMLRRTQWQQQLANCTTPTTILWGRDDQIFAPSLAAQVARLMPQTTLHIITECGHLPHQERPNEVVTYLR